jgi:hypothetical protein
VIVEFKEEPLFINQQRSFASLSVTPYEQRFPEFMNDLQATAAQISISAKNNVALRRQFYRSFFGASVSMPYGMITSVEQLPYVKKVHTNKQMKASLHKSIPQIRANEVWTNYGATGEGVRVGIIDTGIDYLHPALGGGIGTSFKVIGGYDFADNDNDPMDENGHGTHVAGIVAADAGNIKGVAPKAKLYAFRVLDAEGQGSEDDVIAAIERTVDPDNDGSMNDRLDVVNMSLGSSDGDPDDAGSVAVDNAVRLGVTFVIAAGNDGQGDNIAGKENNYFYNGMETIGSPGTSRLAITVGAVDSVNGLAYFSSKGPVARTFGIKPEVTAPGVNILSLFPGNDYLTESGTSMASPMIAGVAALLKSKEPGLTPAQVKSKIVNSAVDLGMKPVLQGAGRVDAMRAVSLSSYAVPTHLSFGLDDPSNTTWTKVETVLVSNGKGVSQNYAVSFSGGAAGITLSSVPANFTIAPGGTQSVLVTVSVNNTVIPIVNEDIILYDGFMHVKSAADTLHLPWTFARTTKMTLTFSHPDPYFVGSSFTSYLNPRYHKVFSRVQWIDPKTVEISGAPMETFDFGILYPNTSVLVLKGGLQFTGSQTFSFNAADAVHTIHFDGTDNTGVPFDGSAAVKRSLRVNLPAGFLYAALQPGSKSIKVSPASAQFEFHPVEALMDLRQGKRVVIPQYASFKGISSDVHITNTSASYLHQKMRFIMPEGVTKTRMFSDVITVEKIGDEHYYNTILVGVDTLDVPQGDAWFDLYMMKTVDPSYSASIGFHTNSSYLTNTYLDMSTRYFSIVNDSIMTGLPSQELETTYKSPNGGTMEFGAAPVYVSNLSYNNSFGTSVHFAPYFHGSLFEHRFSDINNGSYAIYDDAGTLLKSEALNVFPRFPFEAEPKKYSLVITSRGYAVKNVKGTLTLRNDVDLSKTVADAPIITSFQIRNAAGRMASNLSKNEQARLTFSAKVLAFPLQVPVGDSTRIYYRKFKTTEWIPLPVIPGTVNAEKEGTIYAASLAPATTVDSVAIDLKIRVVDQSGNAAEQILAPAFSVGNWTDDGTTAVEDERPNVPAHFSLHQNFPNPFNPATSIRYDVPAGGPVELTVYDILGREVAVLVKEFRNAGTYTAEFNAGALASGIYLYRLSAGGAHAVKKMMLVK